MDIETDDARLQQVLINLLINATKFTPQGSIILELRKQSEQELLFSVTDTGCGIPKEKQAAIFRRFEKLNENAQGSGLGLSICQLIIEHIGGKYGLTQTIQAAHASSSLTPSDNHSPLKPKRRITHEKIIYYTNLLTLLLPVQIINADVQSQNSVLRQHSIEIEGLINNDIRKADSLVKAGKPDEALTYYKSSLKSKDSLYNLITNSQMEEILSLYNMDKLILQREQRRSMFHQACLYISVIIILALLLTNIHIYRSRKRLQKMKKKSED